MQEYRFVIMQQDGSVRNSSTLRLPDDLSALDHAKALIHDQPIEGWQAGRRVFRLLPDGTSGI